jgi:triacylglycerol lipase
MVARLRAAGWASDELDDWGYDSRLSNRVIARRLAAEAARLRRRTGADRIDVITHSMGALSSRFWLERLGGTRVVRRWVSLGGPNHGIAGPPLCGFVSCRELRAGSAFLQRLNRGDPTPGPTVYATWWSPCDTVINPDASVALRGARNVRTPCLSHSALVSDRRVYAQVRAFVAGG